MSNHRFGFPNSPAPEGDRSPHLGNSTSNTTTPTTAQAAAGFPIHQQQQQRQTPHALQTPEYNYAFDHGYHLGQSQHIGPQQPQMSAPPSPATMLPPSSGGFAPPNNGFSSPVIRSPATQFPPQYNQQHQYNSPSAAAANGNFNGSPGSFSAKRRQVQPPPAFGGQVPLGPRVGANGNSSDGGGGSFGPTSSGGGGGFGSYTSFGSPGMTNYLGNGSGAGGHLPNVLSTDSCSSLADVGSYPTSPSSKTNNQPRFSYHLGTSQHIGPAQPMDPSPSPGYPLPPPSYQSGMMTPPIGNSYTG